MKTRKRELFAGYKRLYAITEITMITPIDNNLDESKIWLHRYMPLNDLKYWFNEKKFFLNFTRMEFFDDILEGWGNEFPELKIAWRDFLDYSKRVKDDTGEVEAGKYLISKIVNFHGDFDKKNVIYQIEKYIELIESNFVSCWFVSDSDLDEKRYMWDIYGKASQESGAFKLSIKWEDLKKALTKSNKKFIYGKINYDDKIIKNALFNKDYSYIHENEFRIISKEFTDDYNSFLIESNIKKTITLKGSISNKYDEFINSVINDKYDKIKHSDLPMQWKLREIKGFL